MKNKLTLIVLGIFLCLMANVVAARVVDVFQNDNLTNKLNSASAGDTVRFYPGTYEINIVLDSKQLILEGVDTENTILKSKKGTTSSIIEVRNASTIRNFTFLEGSIGISIPQSASGLTIVNNVFRLGVNNTALSIGELVSGEISNNTFFGNSINLINESTSIIVKNNIFDSYTTFIQGTIPGLFTFNCIKTNELLLDASNKIETEATFVNSDIDVNDFHLQKDSNCIDAGEFNEDFDDSQTDIGAYGGSNFDKIPEAMSITSIDDQDVSALSTLEVQWAKSLDHQVAGYKLYYSASPLYSATQNTYLNLDDRNALNPIIIEDVDVNSTAITNLNIQSEKPMAPVLTSVLPGKNKLNLGWGAVEFATFYTVHYVTGDEAEKEVDVGNVTSYTLTELNNGVVYTVWLEAKHQLSYYFQVATYIGDPRDAEFAESYFVKEDEKLDIGEAVASDISNKIAMQPEAIVAYPILPNEGCFIATAAFGYYSAEQVQVLRNFRDNYLLTSQIGQGFVSWYYHYGPYAADVINDYPALKPVTRVLLYPLIIAAELLEVSIAGFFLYVGFIILLLLSVMSGAIFKFRRRVINT